METQKISTKRIVCIILYVLIIVFTFLALGFNLYEAEGGMDIYDEYYYAHTEGNGFSVILAYPLALARIGDYLGIYSLIMMLIVIAQAITYGIMVGNKAKKTTLIEKIFIIIDVVLTLVYMVNGFYAKGEIQNFSPLYKVSTVAFIPFIIICIFAMGYFLVDLFGNINKGKTKEKIVRLNGMQVIDELERYIQLLDAGVITQEDYEMKKKELLEL